MAAAKSLSPVTLVLINALPPSVLERATAKPEPDPSALTVTFEPSVVGFKSMSKVKPAMVVADKPVATINPMAALTRNLAGIDLSRVVIIARVGLNSCGGDRED